MLVRFIRYSVHKILVLQTDANNKVHATTYNSSSDLPEDLRTKYFAQMVAERMTPRRIKRSR